MGNPPAHKARKRFGQNFLHDPNIIQRMVSAINPLSDQNLVEIGPGLGALTFPVLSHCQKMSAIEIDRDLITHLQKEHKSFGDLELTVGDALKLDYSAFGKSLRIIGNLPYNITSPLLFHLLGFRDLIEDMHFMLQKEVVNRIVSPPGSKVYGRLSVMIQAYCYVEKLFIVPPNAFNPPPAVDSAIIRLIPKDISETTLINHQNFSLVVKSAFAHRRKTLRNNLRFLIDQTTLIDLGISPSERAENLTIEQFITLSKQLFCSQ